MTRFSVSPERLKKLIDKMNELEVEEEDLEEKFIKGSGPGGQKINKSSTCVYLIHKPSKIEIKCQKTRSQSLNRYYARKELCERLEEQIYGEESKKQKEIEKIRRQKRKRNKRAKEKILSDKKHRSITKEKRRGIKEV